MRLLHVMIRVADLDKSIKFYKHALGMCLLRQKNYPEGKFTTAFLGYDEEDEDAMDVSGDPMQQPRNDPWLNPYGRSTPTPTRAVSTRRTQPAPDKAPWEGSTQRQGMIPSTANFVAEGTPPPTIVVHEWHTLKAGSVQNRFKQFENILRLRNLHNGHHFDSEEHCHNTIKSIEVHAVLRMCSRSP